MLLTFAGLDSLKHSAVDGSGFKAIGSKKVAKIYNNAVESRGNTTKVSRAYLAAGLQVGALSFDESYKPGIVLSLLVDVAECFNYPGFTEFGNPQGKNKRYREAASELLRLSVLIANLFQNHNEYTEFLTDHSGPSGNLVGNRLTTNTWRAVGAGSKIIDATVVGLNMTEIPDFTEDFNLTVGIATAVTYSSANRNALGIVTTPDREAGLEDLKYIRNNLEALYGNAPANRKVRQIV